jgi:lipoprotein NlpI
MRRVLIGLILVLAAMPAWAQTRDEYIANCESKDVDLSLRGCTGMLQLKPQMTPEFRLAAYFSRAMRYHSKGLEDQAIADYRTALKLDPDAQSVKDVLKRLGATP